MAGKPKHGYKIRQRPSNEWEILARKNDGEEFWHGPFTMKQNAVRWGDSHKIEGRYPQVVESFDDPFGIESSSAQDPINRSFQQLCRSVDVDQTNSQEVAEFCGLSTNQLFSIVDPASGTTIWQPLA